MLSGDNDSITQEVANELGTDHAKGGLLPEDKLNVVERLKISQTPRLLLSETALTITPVLAASDVRIAGSDVAIETADALIPDRSTEQNGKGH